MSREAGKPQARKRAGIVFSAVVMLTVMTFAIADAFIKSPELLGRIRVGETTSQQVTEILGPPVRVEKFARRQVESWDYRMREGGETVIISIEIDSKGTVSGVQRLRRFGP